MIEFCAAARKGDKKGECIAIANVVLSIVGRNRLKATLNASLVGTELSQIREEWIDLCLNESKNHRINCEVGQTTEIFFTV